MRLKKEAKVYPRKKKIPNPLFAFVVCLHFRIQLQAVRSKVVIRSLIFLDFFKAVERVQMPNPRPQAISARFILCPHHI